MNLELESTHGRPSATFANGSKIIPFGAGNYAYPCGTGIQYGNVNQCNGAKDFWVPGDGVHQITHCVINPKGNLMVCAERRLAVNLLVFGAAERKLQQKLQDVCKVSIKDMCFSRCGNYFAVLAAGPSFHVVVFSVDPSTYRFHRIVSSASGSNSPLNNTNNAAQNFRAFTTISFNPRDPTDICTTGGGHAAFWKLTKSATTSQWSIQMNEAKVTQPNVRLTTHAWTTGGVPSFTAPGNLVTANAIPTGSPSTTNYGSGAFGGTLSAAAGSLQFGKASAEAGGANANTLGAQLPSGLVLVGTMNGEVYEFDVNTKIGHLVLDLNPAVNAGDDGLIPEHPTATSPQPLSDPDDVNLTIGGGGGADESASSPTKGSAGADHHSPSKGHSVTAITITKHCILIGTEDGTVRVCTHDLAIVKTIKLPIVYNALPRPSQSKGPRMFSQDVGVGLRSICMTPEWNSAFCASGDGSIFMLNLPGFESPVMNDLPNIKVVTVSNATASAKHAVAGLVHLPSKITGFEGAATSVATLSTEGLFRVFNYGANVEVLSKYLPGAGPSVEPTCMEIGSGDASKCLIAVGYSNGVVQAFELTGQETKADDEGGSPLKIDIKFHELMTRPVNGHPVLGEGIIAIKFDPTGKLCFALTQQCSVIFFGITPAGPNNSSVFDVKSICTVAKAASSLESSLPPLIMDAAWFPQGEYSILVSLANSEIMMLSVPTENDLHSYQSSILEAKENGTTATTVTTTSAQSGITVDTTAFTTVTASTTEGSSEGDAAAKNNNNTQYDITADRVTINTWRLDLPAHKVVVGSLYDDSFKLLAMSADKETKVYNISRTLQIDRKDRETRTIKCEETHSEHDKRGNCMVLARSGRVLVTGGADGKVVVRDVTASLVQSSGNSAPTAGAQASVAHRHVSMDNGVAHVCVSADAIRLITVGYDGLLTINTFGKQAPFHRGPFQVISPVQGEAATQDEAPLYFSEKRAKTQYELEQVQHSAERQSVKEALGKLSEELALIRRENDSFEDETERVKLTDFLVTTEKDRFQSACDDAIQKMREENRWDNLTRDYIIDKLKKECVDTMEAPMNTVKAMLVGETAAEAITANASKKNKKIAETESINAVTPSADQEVHNMPMRKMDSNELVLLRKLKFLRVVEKKDREIRQVKEMEEIRAKVEPNSPSANNNEAKEGGDLGAAAAKEAAEAEQPELAQKGRRLEEEAADPVDPYLYHPWMVYTKARAILQIRLLEGRILNLKTQFNAEFNSLKRRKSEDISKMEEKNAKAQTLVLELDEKHLLFQPRLTKAENPKELLTVDDSDVPADKTTDPTEKKRLEQVEVERQRWLERHGDDGSSDRALKVWMDGRLDKEIKVLEVKVDLPDFANENSEKFVPLEERSEDQQKAFREYEKKLQKKKEEVEARRKLLQGELAVIKNDNLDTAREFDAKVKAVFEWRLQLVRQCYEVELQQIKLVQGVVQQGHRVKLHKKVEQQKISLADKLVQASKTTAQQKLVLERKQEELLQLQNDEKGKEKNMRALPPFVDFEDQSELLYKLFMKRKPKKGKSNVDKRTEEKKSKIRNEIQNDAQNHPDPFAFVEKDEELKRKIQQAEESVPLPRIDRPGECPDVLWDAFQRFRQDRVDADRDMKRMAEDVEKAGREEEDFAVSEGQCRVEAEEAIREVARFQKDAVRAGYDVDELHVFRQGLVEVEQRPVVTDYANAILIASKHIERLNELIRGSGTDQVQMMHRIGDKRKELRMIEWEIEHLEYLRGTLEMEHSHLHTLRVTKQMQAFINGGGEDHNEKERTKLLQKIEHVRSSMALKIEERKHQMLTLRRSNKEKELENRLLQEQVSEAKELVDERTSIHDLQSSELDKERTSKLMRDMRVTRKLEDVAKAQQEEMVQLKREIDKLRERTFPSFAVVSKRVVGNPDES